MSREITTPPNPSASPPPSAEKKALLDAFDTVLKSQAEERDASQRDAEARRRARASSRPLMGAATAILLMVGAYLAIVQPPWVFAPRATPETLALKEASLRVSIANAAQHVERYRKRNARLPESLAEAGARSGGLRYDRLGPENFRLAGENGPAHVTFTSGESLPDFLGNSYPIITRRPR
ncbi:MAG: hypothetical protein ACREL3_06695 [Gemmatimonadales bacterium]